MRILFFTHGGSSHDSRFLTKFVQKGYKVCYVYLSPQGKKYEVEKTESHCLGCDFSQIESIMEGAINGIKLYHPFKRILRSFNPDILHAGWVQTAGLMAAATGYHPFLLMPWGSDILVSPQKSFIQRKIAQYVTKRADMIACDAEEVKKRIIEIADYPEDKIVTFPWGIDLKIFHPSRENRLRVRQKLGWSDKKILVMTRTFLPVYGIEYFLRAIPEIVEKFPQTKVLVSGSGPLEGFLHGIVKELKISDEVLFLGQIPNADLVQYLNAADIYVSSSLSDGTSLSLLEAMACALPVVVSDVPAILEWIQDGVNGLVVPRKNTTQLVEKISYLLQDEGLAHKMGKKNFEIAQERANWDKNFKRLEEMYATLARGK